MDRTNLEKKQSLLFKKIEELVNGKKIVGETIWSLGKASFTDKMYGFKTHASKLTDDFKSKLSTREIDINEWLSAGRKATGIGFEKVNAVTQRYKSKRTIQNDISKS